MDEEQQQQQLYQSAAAETHPADELLEVDSNDADSAIDDMDQE